MIPVAARNTTVMRSSRIVSRPSAGTCKELWDCPKVSKVGGLSLKPIHCTLYCMNLLRVKLLNKFALCVCPVIVVLIHIKQTHRSVRFKI